MTKVLFFTDPHVRISNPRSRKDNFVETILKKLEYVGKLGDIMNVDAFVCGGDWLDRPDIPYSMLGQFIGVMTKFGRPIYTVIGNHEEYGYNPDTHSRTALVALTSAGILTRLSSTDPALIGDNIAITGADAHSKLDKGFRTEDYVVCPRVEGRTNIRVVHGYLKDGPEFNRIPSTDISDILDTQADVILTGHEHSGYGVIHRSGKTFCNPGALARVSASVGDVNLEVKVALVTVDMGEVTVELIPLPAEVARPASEVLDRVALEEEKAHKQAMTEFSNSARNAVERFSFNDKMDVFQALEKYIEDEDVEDDVALILRRELERAQEEVTR